MHIEVLADVYYRSSRRVTVKRTRGHQREHESQKTGNTRSHDRRRRLGHQREMNPRPPLSPRLMRTPLPQASALQRKLFLIQTKYQRPSPSNKHRLRQRPLVHPPRRSRCTPSLQARQAKRPPRHQESLVQPPLAGRVPFGPSPLRASIPNTRSTAAYARSLARRPSLPTSRTT